MRGGHRRGRWTTNRLEAGRLRGEARELQLILESVPDAPRRARDALRPVRGRLDPEVYAHLRMVVTELISSCVQHGGGGPIEVRVELLGRGRLRGEVAGEGAGAIAMRETGSGVDGGMSRRIVDELTEDWGVHPESTCVWFELVPRPLY